MGKLKIALASDFHGYLPVFTESVDVFAICGDIFPLEIQHDAVKSTVWFIKEFCPWAESLDCGKVILVPGNHDMLFEKIMRNRYQSDWFEDIDYVESSAAKTVAKTLRMPEKIVYLQDSAFEYNGVKFYGTPWCPVLINWAFYKPPQELARVFGKIPDDCDVLLTHSPGTENDMGTSLHNPSLPQYGCAELTEKVNSTRIKLWAAGHVHSGNHRESVLSNGITRIMNVSLKDEDYRVRWEPVIVTV